MSFIDKLTDAVMAFRDPLPEKMLSLEQKSLEDRPNFGRAGSLSWLDTRFSTWDWARSSDPIDYRRELGRLDNSSLVMGVVNYTGISLAEALPVVTKPNKKGEPEIVPDHEAADLIRRPNPWHIWADYCLAGAFSWWMGNWYMKKVRAESGELIELWYLPHFLVEPRWPDDGGTPAVPIEEADNTFISHYQYNQPGREPVLIPRSEMVHIKRGVNLDNPRKGIGVWDGVLQELYGDSAVNRFSAAILKNMGMVQVLLSPKDKEVVVEPAQAAHIKEQWIINSTGANANKPMVNPVALDVTKLSFSPKELDLKELNKAPQAAIAGVTGIPSIILQHVIGLEHGHYGAAYEQARQQGYENVIIPIQSHIAEDLTWQVLPEIDKTKGAKIGFDTSKVRVLQEDQDSIVKREAEVFRSGGSSLDQYLMAIGKEPVGPPLGEIRLVPSTSTPMSPERLLEAATTIPEPVAPTDPQALAKLMDIDRMLAGFEKDMKGFELPK